MGGPFRGEGDGSSLLKRLAGRLLAHLVEGVGDGVGHEAEIGKRPSGDLQLFKRIT